MARRNGIASREHPKNGLARGPFDYPFAQSAFVRQQSLECSFFGFRPGLTMGGNSSSLFMVCREESMHQGRLLGIEMAGAPVSGGLTDVSGRFVGATSNRSWRNGCP
jgi:hypothetical protein